MPQSIGRLASIRTAVEHQVLAMKKEVAHRAVSAQVRSTTINLLEVARPRLGGRKRPGGLGPPNRLRPRGEEIGRKGRLPR
eukprot:7772646-Heterocapsa_arctica.AAC.1